MRGLEMSMRKASSLSFPIMSTSLLVMGSQRIKFLADGLWILPPKLRTKELVWGLNWGSLLLKQWIDSLFCSQSCCKFGSLVVTPFNSQQLTLSLRAYNSSYLGALEVRRDLNLMVAMMDRREMGGDSFGLFPFRNTLQMFPRKFPLSFPMCSGWSASTASMQLVMQKFDVVLITFFFPIIRCVLPSFDIILYSGQIALKANQLRITSVSKRWFSGILVIKKLGKQQIFGFNTIDYLPCSTSSSSELLEEKLYSNIFVILGRVSIDPVSVEPACIFFNSICSFQHKSYY